MANVITKFKVGKKYSMRSVCNQDCVWSYIVESRTNATVVLRQLHSDGTPYGDTARFRINKKLTEWNHAECVSPLGTFSMSPVLVAR